MIKRFNLEYIYWAAGSLSLILLILYRLLGTQGRYVLFGCSFFGLAVILLSILILLPLFIQGKDRRATMVAVLIIGILLMGYGVYTETCVFRDMRAGTIITEMKNCAVYSRSGIHGITGFHYYLQGKDSHDELMEFPISFREKDAMEGLSTVTVEFYENIGRILSYY